MRIGDDNHAVRHHPWAGRSKGNLRYYDYATQAQRNFSHFKAWFSISFVVGFLVGIGC